MRDRAILLLALAALVAAACGGGATTTTEGPDESATSTTTTQSDTNTSAPTSTTTTSSDKAFTRMEDLTYLTIEGEAFEGDIYVPDGEGPWPVVVMFHGNSPSGKNDSHTTVVAEAAATAGMYVFVPNWLTGYDKHHPRVVRLLLCSSQLCSGVCPTRPRCFAACRRLRIFCGSRTGIPGGTRPCQRADPRLRRRESTCSDHRSGLW